MTYLFVATQMVVEAADGTRGRLIDVALSLRDIPMKESTRRLQNQIFIARAPYLVHDTSPSYLLFQTLLTLCWTLTCMI